MSILDNISNLSNRIADYEIPKEQVKADLDAFINGQGPVPDYTSQGHPFWSELGKHWNPTVKKALGGLWTQWKGKRGWEGGAGNINYTFNGHKSIRNLTAEDAVEMLEAEGFDKARKQPHRDGQYMLVKKRQPVNGGIPLPVFVKVVTYGGDAIISASIGVEADDPN